jgi:glucosamine-6-phosphate deaminase
VRLRVLGSAEEVAYAAADFVRDRVAARPDLALALPTGRTPVLFYAELERRHERGEIALERARSFNLDELALEAADPRSFHAFMQRHAWGRIGLDRARCDIPNGTAPDLEAECRRYEEAIAAAGGIDLAVLGVGADGHIAYNLPGPITLPTHVVRLPDGLAASLGLDASALPLRAITMGLGTIRAARELLLLATGETKAVALAALERGRLDPQWPCTFLAPQPSLVVLADPAAGSALARPAQPPGIS